MQMRMNGRNALVTGVQPGHRARHCQALCRCGRQCGCRRTRAEGLDEARAEIAAASNAKVISVAADVGTAEGCRTAYETAQKARSDRSTCSSTMPARRSAAPSRR
jgi:NAD(P)-dependent dehydrogenase (short-subunit alcohol dehydrogenase family)